MDIELWATLRGEKNKDTGALPPPPPPLPDLPSVVHANRFYERARGGVCVWIQAGFVVSTASQLMTTRT